ncbi:MULTISPECIES: LemA family protein [unclassified Gilliamella]|uniref:LemA family protein n=1 Tax=unclassified Gilliamella TaxID=2685620 RepID=UPI002269E7C8|nr:MULTISPECIES: LemA family protein [unclassified Gilliamella]MCX8642851.1 LemA family protein [Gilliamella sp. B3835]MCX8708190.1 LemA family protein [Gilliamella sp. B3783]MCX8710088.1 LemA family protein [Gilliamella sp. B3780]MCX8715364.1 LemA family protein [Gilliamella sp. B3781]MCX8717385.1 LemA family protein [Gilliamella sp. B3784]
MKSKSLLVILVLIIIGGFIFFKDYNSIQTQDEAVAASWSEVINQYKRRADLVPNLVNTVKGYATHEKEVLTQVTDARAKVGSIQINADQLTDPTLFSKFQQAQSDLSSALSRLIAVSENYPDLKANTLYQDLMSQLEGTENRITVARGRYIETVKNFNSYIRTLPTKWVADILGQQPKQQFTVDNEKQISDAPAVNFGQ